MPRIFRLLARRAENLEFTEKCEIPLDARLAAETAGLVYCPDDVPGISRRRRGNGFVYVGPDGKVVKDARILARIKQIAIPPAWIDVWISTNANGHLAATGRDARGRKQYRYNPQFTQVRDAAKYGHLTAFARGLPRLRRIVASHMALKGLPREKVLATVVRLLELSGSRIGNQSYADENNSYGLSTLRNRHVRVRGSELKFLFPGKGGKIWRFNINSKRVAKVIRACQELPGQQLFEYRDEEGNICKIGSGDVNDYLRAIVGTGMTAKDFRTWAGTVEAALVLNGLAARRKQPTKADVRAAFDSAARRLANTAAICRKCYVHPDVIDSYETGNFLLSFPHRKSRARFALTDEEAAVLRFIESCRRKGRR